MSIIIKTILATGEGMAYKTLSSFAEKNADLGEFLPRIEQKISRLKNGQRQVWKNATISVQRIDTEIVEYVVFEGEAIYFKASDIPKISQDKVRELQSLVREILG